MWYRGLGGIITRTKRKKTTDGDFFVGMQSQVKRTHKKKLTGAIEAVDNGSCCHDGTGDERTKLGYSTLHTAHEWM
jgi:hypothetical protein